VFSQAIALDRVATSFFELDSFAAGAFFSRCMLRISLVQAYYNRSGGRIRSGSNHVIICRYVVTLMGVLLRAGPLFASPLVRAFPARERRDRV
jgi:hypothetical protein